MSCIFSLLITLHPQVLRYIAAASGQHKLSLVYSTIPKIRSMLSFPNPQRAVSDVSSSRCLPKGSSDARPYHPKCFRVLRENPFSSVGNGLLPEQPIKVHVSASIYYLLFSLLFSSAKSAWPSVNPIIEAIVPIKKKLSVCKSTRLKINLSLMP